MATSEVAVARDCRASLVLEQNRELLGELAVEHSKSSALLDELSALLKSSQAFSSKIPSVEKKQDIEQLPMLAEVPCITIDSSDEFSEDSFDSPFVEAEDTFTGQHEPGQSQGLGGVKQRCRRASVVTLGSLETDDGLPMGLTYKGAPPRTLSKTLSRGGFTWEAPDPQQASNYPCGSSPALLRRPSVDLRPRRSMDIRCVVDGPGSGAIRPRMCMDLRVMPPAESWAPVASRTEARGQEEMVAPEGGSARPESPVKGRQKMPSALKNIFSRMLGSKETSPANTARESMEASRGSLDLTRGSQDGQPAAFVPTARGSRASIDLPRRSLSNMRSAMSFTDYTRSHPGTDLSVARTNSFTATLNTSQSSDGSSLPTLARSTSSAADRLPASCLSPCSMPPLGQQSPKAPNSPTGFSKTSAGSELLSPVAPRKSMEGVRRRASCTMLSSSGAALLPSPLSPSGSLKHATSLPQSVLAQSTQPDGASIMRNRKDVRRAISFTSGPTQEAQRRNLLKSNPAWASGSSSPVLSPGPSSTVGSPVGSYTPTRVSFLLADCPEDESI